MNPTNTWRDYKIQRDETQRDFTDGKKKRNHFDVSLCEKASLRSPEKQ